MRKTRGLIKVMERKKGNSTEELKKTNLKMRLKRGKKKKQKKGGERSDGMLTGAGRRQEER